MHRTRQTLPLLVIAMMAALPLHGQSGYRPVPQATDNGVDPAVRPGDDFFSYANGAWLKTTVIPAGSTRWNARNEIDVRTRDQLARVLDDAGQLPDGTLGRKVADFRAAYANEDAIEARGLAPLSPMLDSIARIRDK